LSEYERTVIDALMPNADEITSKDVEKAHAGTDFDPMDAADAWLRKLAPDYSVRRASKFFSFALMAAGGVLLVMEMLKLGREPFALLAALIPTNIIASIWPSRGRLAMAFLFIPLVLLFGVVLLVHTITYQPAGIYASAGAVLMALGGFHILVNDAARRDPRPAALIDAREWLRSQPYPRPDLAPYLEPLGLSRAKLAENEEGWGYALCTVADD